MKVGQPFNPRRVFVGIYLPEAIAAWKEISPTSKLAYGHLFRRAGNSGKCFPSHRDISDHVGVSERQVARSLKELVRVGLIRVVACHDKSGRQTTNEYEFLWHHVLDGSVRMGEGDKNVTLADGHKSAGKRVTEASRGRVTHTAPSGMTNPSPHEERTNKNQQNEFSSPTPPVATAAPLRNPEEDVSVLMAINEHAAAGADVAHGVIEACQRLDPEITGYRVARLVHASVSGRIRSAGYFLKAVPKLVGTPADRPDSPPEAPCAACCNSGMLVDPDRFCSCQGGTERQTAIAQFTSDDWAELTADGYAERDYYLRCRRALERAEKVIGAKNSL